MNVNPTISVEQLDNVAYRLCYLRWTYGFKPWVEQPIVRAAQRADLLEALVRHVLVYLDGDDGDLRVGAAELLGAITPLSMREEVVLALQRHLSDGYIRDYDYSGLYSDEEDMRTVCGCAEQSIRLLLEATDPPPEVPSRGIRARIARMLRPTQSDDPPLIWRRDARIV